MADGPRIRVLPVDVVNRIAAGEVIERPASVVKELVENALDAGATRIEVEVRDGGKRLIRVADDGHGMSPEDLERAFLPHATSKLDDVDDLLHIATMGFRGEALASIGAVARARITTCAAGTSEGFTVENAFGEVSPVRPAAATEGTVVEVADIFQRVPARSKFLKSKGAEMARITEAMQQFGICTPDVEFRLVRGGRTVLHFPRSMSRRERIGHAYGRDLLDDLIPAEGQTEGLHLHALLAPPSRVRRDASRMLFFLNGRRVRDKTLIHAARMAYDDLIFGPVSPMVFVFLTMDPALVDQNVHPAKLEVRFGDSRAVHSLVHGSLRRALVSADLAHPLPTDRAGRAERVRDAMADYLARNRGGPEVGGQSTGQLFAAGPPGGGRETAGGDIGTAVDFLQVRDTYIILETADGITVLDQHALHERVLYDRLRQRHLSGRAEIQRLLRPVIVEAGPVAAERLVGRRESLEAIGLLLDAFGEDGVAVHGLPAAASAADPVRVVEDLIDRLDDDAEETGEAFVGHALATLACRAAVRAGDRLGRAEVSDLLEEAAKITHAHTCPHGRPTTLRISYGDLERHFKRK